MVSPRAFAGCSRIDSIIYCMGGFSLLDNFNKPTLLNEHISLDLSQINNHYNDDGEDSYFLKFNSSQLKWNQLSNINKVTGITIPLIGHLATTTLFSEKSYITYGGLQYNSTGNIVAPDYPFMQYNVLNDTWNPLPIPSNSIEFLRASIINVGNDVIWKFGSLPITMNNTQYVRRYSLFDYKNLTWTGPFVENIQIPNISVLFTSGQTITLVNNVIYKLGGSSESEIINGNESLDKYRKVSRRNYDSLNNIYTFDTVHMKWSKNIANGITPLRRNYHTATYLPDENVILIYGGAMIFGNDVNVLEYSNYVIYNITSNTFIEIEEPSDTPFPKERYGHYATLYNSKYLLLMFGGTISSQPADIINVLNIQNVSKPLWIADVNNLFSYEVENNNVNHQLSTTTLIIIIVISVVVALLLIIIVIFYMKHKMKEKKENMQLEKEDPRKSIYGIKEYNLIKPNLNDEEEEGIKIQQQEQLERLILNDTDQLSISYNKSSQLIFCMANENQYEEKTLCIKQKTKEVNKNSNQSSTLHSSSLDLKSSSSSPSTDTHLLSIQICKPSVSDI